MTRQEKYKDTKVFHFFNANPKGRITTDCVIRAISTATGIPYQTVVMEMAEMQCKTGYDDGDPKAIDRYLASKGWIKHKQPRKDDNTKYTGREWCTWLSVNKRKSFGSIVANIGGHHTVAIVPTCSGDGINDRFKVLDIWDPTDGCIGNYWTKVG